VAGFDAAGRTGLVEKLKRQGRVNDMFTGATDAGLFEAQSPLWPGSEAWTGIECFNVVEDGNRRFEEYRYMPADGSRAYLPVGFMFETDGSGASEVRVYSDHHLVEDRPPILPAVEGLHPWRSEEDVLHAYFSALNGNWLEAVLDQIGRAHV
jgi:hypothetical protein